MDTKQSEQVTIAELLSDKKWIILLDDSNDAGFDVILPDGIRKKVRPHFINLDSEDLATLKDSRISDRQRETYQQIYKPVQRATEQPAARISREGPRTVSQARPAHSQIRPGDFDPDIVLLIRAYRDTPTWDNEWQKFKIISINTHSAVKNALLDAQAGKVPILFNDGTIIQCFAKVDSISETEPGRYFVTFCDQIEYFENTHGMVEDEGGHPAMSWVRIQKSVRR